MIATYVKEGDTVEYTPTGDVAAGAVVVQGDLVGVTTRPIPANTKGSLTVRGVFSLPKTAGGGTAIAVGTVYWDATNQVVTATASGNTLLGKAELATTDDDTTVQVRLFQ